MTHTHNNSEQAPSPRAEVRVARIDPKVLKWVILVVTLVTVMMFTALVVHGMVLSNRIHLWQ